MDLSKMLCLKLKSGKFIYTTDVEAFKGTIFESQIITQEQKES